MIVSDFSKWSLIGNFDLVTGINLQETQEKQGKKRAISIISTTAKYGSYRRVKKTTPNVRRRVPRQLTPIETEPKQVTLNNMYYLKRFCEEVSERRSNLVVNGITHSNRDLSLVVIMISGFVFARFPYHFILN